MNRPDRHTAQTLRKAPIYRLAAPFRAGIAVLLLLAVAGCATTPAAPLSDADKPRGDVAIMFSTVLEYIRDIYIEDTSVDTLAMAGLRKLSMIEPAATVERDDDGVHLLINGTTVGTARAGGKDNPTGWGVTIEHLVQDGRNASNLLKAADNERLYKTMIDGMLAGLDRYSRYAGTEAARLQREDREGFGGVGISIVSDDNGARVQHVTNGMPAARGGVRPGDIIVAANGTPLGGRSLGDIVEILRGPIGSSLSVILQREGRSEPFTVTMERKRIIPLTVYYERRGGLGYLRMTGFNQDTAKELREGITRSQREIGAALQGIVIDLRGNPGGLLDQAVDAADLLLVHGRISTTRGRHPDSQQIFDASPSSIGDGIPVAVLIDGSSASASEVLAAALQDQGRAVLIGSRSFGKGTVQTVLNLPNDGELILTWADLFAPSGYLLNKLGVLPTVCTSDADDPAAALHQALDTGAAARALRLRRSITSRNSANWKTVEMLCPWRPHDGGDIDIEVARRLLETPGLYQRALQISAATAGS